MTHDKQQKDTGLEEKKQNNFSLCTWRAGEHWVEDGGCFHHENMIMLALSEETAAGSLPSSAHCSKKGHKRLGLSLVIVVVFSVYCVEHS